MAPLNILICGGGIAGPAAAYWLSKLGHTCTIVERHPELRAHGQQIDLREQGVTVARRMGILDEVRRRAVDEEGTGFLDARGRVVAFFGRSGSEEHQSFTSEFEIMRGELCRILFEATSDRVRYRYGVTVDDFAPVGDGSRVRVEFSDGQAAEYDLLIGADGQGSRVRRKMTPNDSYRAFGVFCCYFNMARNADDERSRFLLCSPGKRRVMATRWHSKDLGQGYLMTMSHADEMRKALQSHDPVVQRDLFARVFRGAGWQSERLIDAMHRADDVYVFEALQVTTKPWSKGRVVLLGDAAHAPSFFTGMGTSLALVGAYVLAGELARHGDDVAAALDAYDAKLRPFVEETQQLAPGFPGIMYPDSAWAVRLTHWILAFVAFAKLDKIIGTLSHYLMPEGKKWKVPDYPELEVATESSPAKC
ncbi:FAD binding domain-containing protein [Hirsutella rhossiliensis]|uniref:FAD binding domain-containing protein n=1 Tax=Hirsutella rhossiliensis TaxID=111463 RepID=A0A9P8MN29_9HYPO|nr:FAD binding domain-containing protein [Hirsutella rhossiliensis]KAH0958418.1 FAD binding domain-containing protein [Hirsutella rhossiliensis]